MFARPSARLLAGLLLTTSAAACGGGAGRENPPHGNQGLARVQGRLAVPAVGTQSQPLGAFWRGRESRINALGVMQQALSLDQVSVDLLRVDNSNPDAGPEGWAVVNTAVPDATGTFSFDNLPEGDYSLRVNQPEFATIAYSVDSTEFHLSGGQTVSLVLPLITTIKHGLTDPLVRSRQGGPPPVAAALDRATGEIAVASTMGFALIDPESGTIDLLFSRNLFAGVPLVALAPTTGLVWLLYPDRLVRIDRSIFSDSSSSEVLDYDEPATRLALGDKVRFRMLPPPTGYGGYGFEGGRYFSPDEQTLFASTRENGVIVLDLATMEISRTILGRAIGYNPVSNHLFFTNGQSSQGNNGTEVLVVDASTRMEVNVVAFENVVGAAAVPGDARTVLVGSKLSTSNTQVPFIKVVDASGSVVIDKRAKDYLGVTDDPPVGAPAFDVTGHYFMLGSLAFRILPNGGFDPVPTGIAASPNFNQRVQCNLQRAVDPANLYEIWYGCPQANAAVALISLNRVNAPVAVRPGVTPGEVLLDQLRGRAIFWDADRLVVVHYADAAAADLAEITDLAPAVAPLVAEGAVCSGANPCAGTDEVCAGATDTAYTGRCIANPRLPFRAFCGGFGQAACDEDFTCVKVNATNPNSAGICVGLPSRDYAAHGPACGASLPCPTGMSCGAGNRCVPRGCERNADCQGAGEICGAVENLGRVCLVPGSLPDGALCSSASECLHGACVAIKGAYEMGSGYLGDARFGPLGLLQCTTPCYQDADCGSGSLCRYRESYSANFDYVGAEPVWRTHRVELAPLCRPQGDLRVEGCDEVCSDKQLCMTRADRSYCQVGYEPQAWVKSGEVTTQTCLPPATAAPMCRFSCRRSGDCPFTTDCVSGICVVGGAAESRCGLTCGATESCLWFGAGDAGTCMAVDSCRTDADCGGAFGSCAQMAGACIGTSRCTTTADCAAGEECGGVGVPGGIDRFCLPAHCGCSGEHKGQTVCDVGTSTCYLSGWCTDIACGSTPECPMTAPVARPPPCSCPGCAWDVCPSGPPVPVCPSEFSCTGVGALYGHSGHCKCTGAGCQD